MCGEKECVWRERVCVFDGNKGSIIEFLSYMVLLYTHLCHLPFAFIIWYLQLRRLAVVG